MSRYAIERSSDPGKYFYIDITSGSLMTVQSLDREDMPWHNITVLAMEMSESHTHTHTPSQSYPLTGPAQPQSSKLHMETCPYKTINTKIAIKKVQTGTNMHISRDQTLTLNYSNINIYTHDVYRFAKTTVKNKNNC